MRFAVSMNVGFIHEPNDALNHTYVNFLEGMGIEPVLIPNAIRDPQIYAQRLKVQGVVLTGGNDVALGSLGEPGSHGESISERRDAVESKLLRMALAAHKPVLGICRGMQFINVFFGGRLIRDIHSTCEGMLDHVGQAHWNTCADPTMQGLLGADEFVVNSFHRDGITRDALAPGLRVFSVSKRDDLVEGILHPIHPILGIQWHPERPGASLGLDSRLIEHFLDRSLWRKEQRR